MSEPYPYDEAYEVWQWGLDILRWSLDEESMPEARNAWSLLQWLNDGRVGAEAECR